MKSAVSRRHFLHSGMSAGVASMLAAPAAGASAISIPHILPQPAAQREVTFGMVGVGMQGSALFRRAVALPGVRCLAACDLYDGRLLLAKEIAGSGITFTKRYGDLLASPTIDSLVVAVPDHSHSHIVIDALHAGKDVYCEKPLSHSISEGAAVVEATKKTGRIVQVGSQVVSSALYEKARSLVAAGKIGDVSMVELTMGRNNPTGAWEYPPPADLSEDNLDWKTWLGTRPQRPLDPILFARWRCWREFGTGIAGDLMVHLISGMQFVLGLNAMPDRAMSAGGIVRWKDGRDMPDLHVVLFEYGKLIVAVRLTLDTDTPGVTRILGSRGVLQISGNQLSCTPQAGVDLKPSYYDSGLPQGMRTAYEKQWRTDHAAQLAMLPALSETETYEFTGSDDTTAHLRNFFTAVANRTPVVEDAVFGHHAAAACHMANQAYFTGKPVTPRSTG